MAAKKPKQGENPNPTISKAPPPTPTIRGGGLDPGIRSRRPDWNYWNRLPMLSINECIMLLINVEPETYLDSSKKQRYARVCRLVQSFQAAGEFPSYDVDVAPSEFISWAREAGEVIPEKWLPIDQAVLEEPKTGIDAHRRRDALDAAIEMKSSDKFKTPTSLVKEVIPFMQKEYFKAGRFSACFKTDLDVQDLARSINRGGVGSLIKDEEYLAVEDVLQAAS